MGWCSGSSRDRAETVRNHPVQGAGYTPQRNQRLTVRLRATLILGVNMQRRFNPLEADARWQQIWGERQTFRASDDSEKPRSYVLEMLPYPSGRIHIGHVRNYSMEIGSAHV